MSKPKVPTLILHGKQDIVPLWTAKEIHKAISHSKLALIQECDHFSHVEQKSKILEEIRDFLNRD